MMNTITATCIPLFPSIEAAWQDFLRAQIGTGPRAYA
jgi:hypothetical protein